ncbi:MAG: U32 family peptidase [Treponema sp.]|nr:U32 family peptidase [Treponema sp.]
MHGIELLAPAGSPEALDAAIGEGADAVYLGLKNFNARMRSANFAYSQFEASLRSLRRLGKNIYVTVNTVFEQREADRMFQLLKYLSCLGPDALIVQDFGVLAMVRSEFPQLKIHASTQMNIASSKGANALSRHGVSRVVLARELSLAELCSLRTDTNMELEVFAHGALCVSASGLCLFSSYLGGKSANRGMCTQACRRLFYCGSKGENSFNEGYYFSPADLQLLEHLPSLAAAGVNAVKIEGRMKSADYVGTVVSAYRLVLDAIACGDEDLIKKSILDGKEILRNDFARSKTTFYFNTAKDTSPPALTWLNPAQDGGTGISLGLIRQVRGKDESRQGLVKIEKKTTGIRLAAGDSIRLHRSDDSDRVSHKVKQVETVRDNTTSDINAYWLSIPGGFGKGDSVYLIQTKAMSKRYKPVITGNANTTKQIPGHEKAPFPVFDLQKSEYKHSNSFFPEGLYTAVSRIEDLYIVQSSRPVRVMLTLTKKIAKYLLDESKAPLPFRRADIIPVLDPYFPQADTEMLNGIIPELIDLGYRQFVANNLGHLNLLRAYRKEIHVITGPWLYMFNAWALSFLTSFEADGYVSPLENNRQNLERTLGAVPHSLKPHIFVPVFAWPPLFRIRADLGQVYDFSDFSDNRDENFRLVNNTEGSLVIPRQPFSITDKIPFLKKAGFRRFVIDLSSRPLRKTDYKDLMRAVNSGAPLPDITRFNWKDGFYNNEKGEN